MNVEKLSKELTDAGLIIEAGFVALCALVANEDTPKAQITEMRMVFFAGAQHLFGSIMTILEPGSEPTDKDMMRMDAIEKELAKFASQFSLQHTPTKGTS